MFVNQFQKTWERKLAWDYIKEIVTAMDKFQLLRNIVISIE